MTAPRVRQVPLRELAANKANPRKISDERFESLKRALAADPEMLQARPLIALPDGRVIAGNMRLKAAGELGWKTIPTITVDLDERRAQEWLLRDNQEYGEWDDPSLAMLLEDLQAAGADLDLTGFSDEEVSRLLDSIAPPPEPDPPDLSRAAEMREKWQTATGQMWSIGEHRIICGDCRNADVVARLCDGALAAMVLADPPYGVHYEGGSGNKTARTDSYSDDFNDYDGFITASLLSAAANSDDEAALHLWFGSSQTRAILAALDAAGWQDRALIIWNKLSAHYGALGAQYKPRCEPLLYCHKRGHSPRWYGATNEPTVWDHEQPSVNADHPTMKPIALYERSLRNHTQRGDIVLELFSGSGTTLLACERMSRIGRAVEIDPGFVAVALERLSALGLEPRLAETVAA